MTPTVHVLAYGRALCGSVHGVPAEWGPGHRWVSAFGADWREHATCAECRRGAELFVEAEAMSWGDRAVILPPPGEDDGETE